MFASRSPLNFPPFKPCFLSSLNPKFTLIFIILTIKMYKLTVFVKDNKKIVSLPKCLKIERDAPYIFLKTATMYWDYNNIGYNDRIKVRVTTEYT